MVKGILVLVGATASGKTDFALRLAKELPIEVVNADALQVYRELEVGTAKPSAAARRQVPHHLINILDPDQPFSAGDFARRARIVISEIQDRGRVPVIVGGSGFYLRALIDGLAPIPSVSAKIQQQIRGQLQEFGLEELQQRLAAVDPEWAAGLEPGDRQRVVRGLEVHQATGIPLSEWQQQAPEEPPLSEVCWIGLTLDRKLLYDRITARTSHMLKAGWLEEVRELKEKYGSEVAAFQAIGYRTLVAVLDDRLAEGEAAELISRETRRYAKRQLTWFRCDSRIDWIGSHDTDTVVKTIQEANVQN